jgi:hypothetical protein
MFICIFFGISVAMQQKVGLSLVVWVRWCGSGPVHLAANARLPAKLGCVGLSASAQDKRKMMQCSFV